VECRQTRDCRVGLTCVRDESGLGGCQLPEEKGCALDSECPDPLVCRQTECTNVCEADRDCPPGAICDVDPDTGDRGCRDPAGDECVLNSDCEAPLICAVDQQCREQCVGDRDCRDGTFCNTTRSPRTCDLPEVPPMDAGADAPVDATPGGDAGTDAAVDGGVDGGMGGGDDSGGDASPTDAAPTDAGPMDSGPMDTGPMDAGPVDTGPVDTGPVDTGPVDTGPMDAGPVDTGPMDTGPVDAGPTDTGATDSGTPTTPPGGPSLFVSGVDHICAVRSDVLYCWGQNTSGQLGVATTVNPSPPVVVPLANVRRLTAWNRHTCAITDTGLYCWGSNDRGQLGTGAAGGTSTDPTLVSGIMATDVSAGRLHTCALTGVTVQCWGANDLGQLGDGTTVDRPAPVAVVGLATDVVQVAARSTHTCALLTDGRAQCWGENNFGQLGNGASLATGVPTASPQLVVGLSNATALYSGSSSVCAVDDVGAASCWGDNVFGQLGDGTQTGRLTPVATMFTDVVEMGLGIVHSCALHSDGSVTCAGDNSTSGQLGVDPSVTFDSATPVTVGALPAAQEIGSGDLHNCARVGLDAYCWGEGRGGQFGDGTTTRESFTPVLVPLP
jgi:alpha-tubulin suppressor-like RCC1 family protein